MRFTEEHKFRIDSILHDRWRRVILPRRGDALIRAFMNKLVEEAERGGEGLLYHIEAGNFSLIKSTIRKVSLTAPIRERDPATGQYLPAEDEGVPYHHKGPLPERINR